MTQFHSSRFTLFFLSPFCPQNRKKSNLPDKNLWFFSIFLLKLKLSKAKAKRWNKNHRHAGDPLFFWISVRKRTFLLTGSDFKYEKKQRLSLTNIFLPEKLTNESSVPLSSTWDAPFTRHLSGRKCSLPDEQGFRKRYPGSCQRASGRSSVTRAETLSRLSLGRQRRSERQTACKTGSCLGRD